MFGREGEALCQMGCVCVDVFLPSLFLWEELLAGSLAFPLLLV